MSKKKSQPTTQSEKPSSRPVRSFMVELAFVGALLACGFFWLRVPTRNNVADAWLSDQPFHGMHILRREQASTDTFWLFLHGQKTDMPVRFRPTSFINLHRELRYLLQKRALDPLELEIGVFTKRGYAITQANFVSEQSLVVYEAGVFMWPPVHVGHTHLIEDLVVDGKMVELTTLTMQPVLFQVHHFLRTTDPDEFISSARRRMVESTTSATTSELKDENSTVHKVSNVRTSSQAWLTESVSEATKNFRQRAVTLGRVGGLDHMEDVQVLRYLPGQEYRTHMDVTELERFPNQPGKWRTEHYGYNARIATIFTYLSTVEEGGETGFPRAGGAPYPSDESSAACHSFFKTKSIKGSAIMWYNKHPSGSVDENSLHIGCAPGKNATEKWSANVWLRPKPYKPSKLIPDHPVLKRLNLQRDDMPIMEDTEAYRDYSATWVNTLDHDAQIVYEADPTLRWNVPAHSSYTLNTHRGHKWLIIMGKREQRLEITKDLITDEKDVVIEDADILQYRITIEFNEKFFS